jgi:hypothetical protein
LLTRRGSCAFSPLGTKNASFICELLQDTNEKRNQPRWSEKKAAFISDIYTIQNAEFSPCSDRGYNIANYEIKIKGKKIGGFYEEF